MKLFDSILLYIMSLMLSVAFHVGFYFRGRKTKLLNSFLYMQVMIFIWIFGKVLVLLSPTREIAWWFTVVQYFSVVFFGNVFLNFAYFYFNNKMLSFRKQLVVIAISGMNYIMLLTNEWHGLFFETFLLGGKTYGPFFYFHTFYSYTLIGVAYSYLFRGLHKNSDEMNRFAKSLSAFGLLLPVLFNILHVFKLTHIEMDITPIMFNVTFLVFGYASYRYRFLDIKHIANQTIFENMQEGIIVLDKHLKVVKFNQIMKEYIKGGYYIEVDMPFEKLMADVSKYFVNYEGVAETFRQFIKSDSDYLETKCQLLLSDVSQFFILHIQKIKESRSKELFTMLRFVEITKHQNALAHLESKNIELEGIHQKMSEEFTVLKKLAIAKERNRISKELHDILGHSLTMVISTLEMSKRLLTKDRASAKAKIIQTRLLMREGFSELKKSVEGNNRINAHVNQLVEELKRMGQEIEALGTRVEVIDRHDYEMIQPPIYDAVYRICQEGLTNAVRHGSAKNITIGIKLEAGQLDLIIADDGVGCGVLHKGNGLLGMQGRTESLGGSFTCGSPEGEGFFLHIKIPLN